MSKEIVDALGQLDVENDAHWTGDGLPLVTVLEELTGSKLTRAEITAAAPQFTRTNVVITVEDTEIIIEEEATVTSSFGGDDSDVDSGFQTPWANTERIVQEQEKKSAEFIGDAQEQLDAVLAEIKERQLVIAELNVEIEELGVKQKELEGVLVKPALTLKQQLDLVHKQNSSEAVERERKREAIIAIMGDDKSLIAGLAKM